jgi:hypothetical protein
MCLADVGNNQVWAGSHYIYIIDGQTLRCNRAPLTDHADAVVNVNKSIVPELFEFYQSFTWILCHVQICITMVSLWSYFSYLQPSTTTILLSELPC